MLTIYIAREVLEDRSLTSFTYVQPMTLDISSAVSDNSNTFILGYFLRGIFWVPTHSHIFKYTRVCVQLCIVLLWNKHMGKFLQLISKDYCGMVNTCAPDATRTTTAIALETIEPRSRQLMNSISIDHMQSGIWPQIWHRFYWVAEVCVASGT